MTHEQIIAELVRIWHSPHLDLILKAGLAEVIETLKENNRSDALVRDSSDDCKESESKLDLISRADAIDACCRGWNNTAEDCIRNIKALPSEEPKTGEWIQDDDYICDQCGYHMIAGGGAYNFCPNCGAKMTKGGEDE